MIASLRSSVPPRNGQTPAKGWFPKRWRDRWSLGTELSARAFPVPLAWGGTRMAARAAALVAAIIDRIEDRARSTGRPPIPTIKVVETLRFFVREGVQWRELRATAGRACGATLRRRLEDWSA